MGVHVPPPAKNANSAGPVLKWAGGKSRLLAPILSQLPPKIDTYFEPFVGSGAVFFALARERRFRRAVLNDRNAELVDVFRALKRDVEGLILALKEHVYEEEAFYRVRAVDPATLDLNERAARTIFLNKTGFNGLYRVNRSGRFNVPFGRHNNPQICNEERLRASAGTMQKVKLSVGGFEETCSAAKTGDAVYFDPPYVPVSKTSNFTAYSQHAFDEPEHQQLARCFEILTQRKVHALLSNSDTPFTQALYKKWELETVWVKRSINADSSKRGDVAELLVRNRLRKPRSKR